MKRKVDDKKTKVVWTNEEDDALLKAVLEERQNREAEADDDDEEEEEEDWDEISKVVPGKTPVQCYKRYTQKFKDAPVPKAEATAQDAEGKDEDDEDEEEDEDSDSPKKAKRGKKDALHSPGWSYQEVELLNKLVEQYKDSKFRWIGHGLRIFSHRLTGTLLLDFSCTTLERGCRELHQQASYRMFDEMANDYKPSSHQGKRILDGGGGRDFATNEREVWKEMGQDCSTSSGKTGETM